jgi:hypothetical protein
LLQLKSAATKSSLQAITSPNVPHAPGTTRPTKIALAVAVVVIAGTALGLHLRNSTGSEQTVTANASAASATVPKSEPSGAISALSPVRPQPARLEIEIEHHFVVARASVWLDNNLVYQKELEGTTKKHALLLERTHGFDASSVKLPAGPHTVKVRVQSGADSYDLSKTVSGTLVSGHQTTLRVTCNRQPNLLQVALR